jgi:hypothetical protein
VEVAHREASLQAVSCEVRSVAGPLATAMAGARPIAAVGREWMWVSSIDWAHSLVVTGARAPVPLPAAKDAHSSRARVGRGATCPPARECSILGRCERRPIVATSYARFQVLSDNCLHRAWHRVPKANHRRRESGRKGAAANQIGRIGSLRSSPDADEPGHHGAIEQA